MTALAYSRLPYWRWRRSRRQREQRRGAVAKPWNGLVLILGLIATDQLTKHLLVSPSGSHVAPSDWLIGAALTLPVFIALLFVAPLQYAAAFAVSGLGSNTLSVLIYGSAQNPFLMFPDGHGVAFNAADTYQIIAAVLAFTAIPAVISIRPRRHNRCSSQ